MSDDDDDDGEDEVLFEPSDLEPDPLPDVEDAFDSLEPEVLLEDSPDPLESPLESPDPFDSLEPFESPSLLPPLAWLGPLDPDLA